MVRKERRGVVGWEGDRGRGVGGVWVVGGGWGGGVGGGVWVGGGGGVGGGAGEIGPITPCINVQTDVGLGN